MGEHEFEQQLSAAINQSDVPLDLEKGPAKKLLEHVCLMLEKEVEPEELLQAWGIDSLALKTFLEHKQVRCAVSVRRFEMKNDGTLARVSAIRALTDNRTRISEYLHSDISANAHATISNFAYKISGLEAKDRASTRDDTVTDFKVVINIPGVGSITAGSEGSIVNTVASDRC